jgi:hypothetical protein
MVTPARRMNGGGRLALFLAKSLFVECRKLDGNGNRSDCRRLRPAMEIQTLLAGAVIGRIIGAKRRRGGQRCPPRGYCLAPAAFECVFEAFLHQETGRFGA